VRTWKLYSLTSVSYVPLPFSDKQHIRHCIAFGGELYPRPEMIDFILRPEPGVEKRVLDIGKFFVVVLRKPD
jgi:hypothetical protein